MSKLSHWNLVYLLVLGAALLLAGCTSPEETETRAPWEAEGISLSLAVTVDDEGRVAVTTAINFPDETQLLVSLYARERSLHAGQVPVTAGEASFNCRRAA